MGCYRPSSNPMKRPLSPPPGSRPSPRVIAAITHQNLSKIGLPTSPLEEKKLIINPIISDKLSGIIIGFVIGVLTSLAVYFF